MKLTKVIWINRQGERREHSLFPCTYFYAMDWFRRNILECQGILSVVERRNSQMKFLGVQNAVRFTNG